MESSILKERAAFALNMILSADKVDYRSFERSGLCFYIQDYHNDIEKEVALALASEWEEIKKYDKLSFFKRLFIRLRFTWKNTKSLIKIHTGTEVHFAEPLFFSCPLTPINCRLFHYG